MGFERVARLSELPKGQGLCVSVGGEEIGLYLAGDSVIALENLCPHAGYPLHEGWYDGRVVVCNGHGWEYDIRTGLQTGVTADEPLRRYAVRIEGDEVWVDPEMQATEFPAP